MADSGSYSPETIARHQKIADMLLMQSVKPREIRSPIQGLGQLGEAALAGWEGYRADRDEKAARNEALAQALAAFGGGGGQAPAAAPVAAPVAAGPAPDMATTQTGDTVPLPRPNPLGGLDPEFRTKFADARTAAGERGVYFDAPQPGSLGGIRTPEQQAALYAQGRTAPGPIVTGTTDSNHIKGRAFDVVPKEGTSARDIGSALTDIIRAPQFAGMRSGATFSNLYDPLHIELNKPRGPRVASADPMADMPRVPVTAPQTAAPPISGDPMAGMSGASPAVANVAAALNGPQAAAGASAGAAALPPSQQVAQNAPVATAGPAGLAPANREAVVRMLMNPWTPDALKSALVSQMNPSYGFQTMPDGTVVRTNPKTGQVDPVYQTSKPTAGVIGEDAFGNKIHGWIDPVKKTVEPFAPPGSPSGVPGAPGGAAAPITITGPDGKPIEVPAGQDPKKFREHVTTATADARAGKLTEVQANATQFANRMEDAEKTIGEVGGEGTSLAGKLAEKVPIVGNYAQSPQYQKFAQAKSQFITALLRKESGAAISKTEFDRYEKEFFPQPGDEPGVIAQKNNARKVAIEAMKKGAGPIYESPKGAVAPVKVSSPDEARKLPKGTAIILPDGSPGVVP